MCAVRWEIIRQQSNLCSVISDQRIALFGQVLIHFLRVGGPSRFNDAFYHHLIDSSMQPSSFMVNILQRNANKGEIRE